MHMMFYTRGLKLKVSRGPHETKSKVWRAAVKNEEVFFESKSNVFLENRPIGPIFLLKSSFFLMFTGRMFETAVLHKVPKYVDFFSCKISPLIYDKFNNQP